MIIVHKNIKKGELKIRTENADDLWYLSSIIDIGDKVKGKTERKIKIGGSDDRSAKIVRKTVFLEIEVEKIEFHRYTNDLRISGKILIGNDDIAKGSYHTFTIDESTTIEILKDRFLSYQLDKLNDASKNKSTKILICSLERDKACFALLKKYGYEILGEISGDVEKKYIKTVPGKNFYKEIIKLLQDYRERLKIEIIVIGSPAFWKDELAKEMKGVEMGRVIFATCNSFGKNAINEILKRPEIKEALKEERTHVEMKIVEKLLSEISKEGNYSYGMKETDAASKAGAIEILMVSENLIKKTRSEGSFETIENIMKIVDDTKGKIRIISPDHDGGKKLDGLGGIAAILRYRITG